MSDQTLQDIRDLTVGFLLVTVAALGLGVLAIVFGLMKSGSELAWVALACDLLVLPFAAIIMSVDSEKSRRYYNR